MSFVSELRRRNVLRVGAAYLVVAWLVLQVVDTIGPMLYLPDAFARGVLLLLAIGFPVALVGSWVFEFTPSGLRTQAEADEFGRQTSSTKLNGVIIAGLVLALAFVIIDAYVLVDPASESSGKTIVVLPFVNNSSDVEQEYCADGLTDALIDKLARVSGLRVAGRASSFYYKGRNEDPRVIGETLGVGYIVQGSVQKAGDDARINAQLVGAADGFELWSDSFAFELSDVFAVQDAIAGEVTKALEITLATGDFSLPGNTRNVEAYDAAIRARYEASQVDPEALTEAVRLARRAVELDPEYVRGWLTLRAAYSMTSAVVSGEESIDLSRQADEALRRAEALAPDLWDVRVDVASVAIRSGRYLEGFRAIQGADRESAQSEIIYLVFMGIVSSLAGQNQQAIGFLQQAKLLEPLDADIHFNLANVLFRLGRYEDAMYAIAEGRGVDPTTRLFPALELRMAREQGNWAEAQALYAELDDDTQRVMDEFVRSGNMRAGLDAINEELDINPGASAITKIALAEYAARFDDASLSLQLLNAAAAQGQGGYIGVWLWDPAFSTIRQSSEFKALVTNLGIVDYWRASDDWGDYCRLLQEGDDFECF